MHRALQGILWTYLDTKGAVGILVLKGKDDVLKRLTTWQTLSSKFKSRKTRLLLDSILTISTIGSWISGCTRIVCQ